MAYIREHRPWSIYLPEHGRGDSPPGWLKNWHGGGIIARVENGRIARAVKASGLPAVDVSAARLLPSIPWVETDDVAIAELAAQHLLERGFRNLAFCGEPEFNWSKWRCDRFVQFVRESGHQCSEYRPSARTGERPTWQREQKDLATWVSNLDKPVGVMACYDSKARQLLDACRAVNIAVPEEVAVIGVDNDELLCNLSDPPLSSVIPDTQQTGYAAARLLDQLMSGRSAPAEAALIKPLGIATRQSTDILAIDDKQIADAVRFIRRHACDGVNVKDVLKAIPLSRRVLESRFRRIVGRTPHEELLRLRLERVKQLLAETELTLAAIASRAGFRHVEYMTVAFKRIVGQPPSVFRGEHRAR